MKYIVYKTTNLVNGKIYIGVHGTEDPNIFDGYLGCGVYVNSYSSYKKGDTPFRKAILKYGVDNFQRQTIEVFDNENEAYILESQLVTKEFVQSNLTYNLALGGRNTELANKKRMIYMYTLDGEYVMKFDSEISAVRYVTNRSDVRGSHITRAIKKGHQFLGYRFSYELTDRLPRLKHLKRKTVQKPHTGNRVAQYDMNNNLIHIFDTMTDCVKQGYKNAKLVAENKRNTCLGYVFKYID